MIGKRVSFRYSRQHTRFGVIVAKCGRLGFEVRGIRRLSNGRYSQYTWCVRPDEITGIEE